MKSTGDVTEGGTSSVHSSQYHHSVSQEETLTVVLQARIHSDCTIDLRNIQINPLFMQTSESCGPITSQHSTCGSNQKLCVSVCLSSSWPTRSPQPGPDESSSLLTLIGLRGIR